MTSREEDNIVLRKDSSEAMLLCSKTTSILHTSSGFSAETAGVLSSKLLFSWANFLAVSVKKSPSMLQAGGVQGCGWPVVLAQAGGMLRGDRPHTLCKWQASSKCSVLNQQDAGRPLLTVLPVQQMPLTSRHQIHG